MEFDLKSNDCLLNLNMSRATKEQKIKWLCQIITNEVDKPEKEQDLSLIICVNLQKEIRYEDRFCKKLCAFKV